MSRSLALLAALALCVTLAAPLLTPGPAESAESKAAPVESAVDSSLGSLKDGFRGVAWGAKKGDLKTLGIYDCKQMDAIVENCGAEKGVNKLEGVPLTLLRYKFANEAFFGLTMKFEARQMDIVKGLIVRELGSPSEVHDGVAHWKNEVFAAWMSNTHFVVNAKKPVEEAIAKNKK